MSLLSCDGLRNAVLARNNVHFRHLRLEKRLRRRLSHMNTWNRATQNQQTVAACENTDATESEGAATSCAYCVYYVRKCQ